MDVDYGCPRNYWVELDLASEIIEETFFGEPHARYPWWGEELEVEFQGTVGGDCPILTGSSFLERIDTGVQLLDSSCSLSEIIQETLFGEPHARYPWWGEESGVEFEETVGGDCPILTGSSFLEEINTRVQLLETSCSFKKDLDSPFLREISKLNKELDLFFQDVRELVILANNTKRPDIGALVVTQVTNFENYLEETILPINEEPNVV